MVQLNEVNAFGYGFFLYSPDVLTEFLKAEKCRARKLCTYFDKNKDVFYKAIESGVILPVYKICAFKYAIFVSINEGNIPAPDGWEEVFKYDDFFIRVGNSNKLCWASFDYHEDHMEPIEKRPTASCKIRQHGFPGVMLPSYDAVDADIPQGNYKFDLIGYKRIKPLDESIQKNANKNYAYGYHFRSTESTQNENFYKADNEKSEFDIHHYLSGK